MGWTSMPKPDSIKEWFERSLSWDAEHGSKKYRCIASSIYQRTTAYGALEITSEDGEKEVVGVVSLLAYYPSESYFDFGHKDLDETMGPNEDKCPERILKLLTPTDHEHALRWRKRCWDNVARSKERTKKLVVGTVLTTRDNKPIMIGEWGPYGSFVVIANGKRGKLLQARSTGKLFKAAAHFVDRLVIDT